MMALARFCLFLVVILVVVSAYLRLQASGIGCPDWPACYGAIGVLPEESASEAGLASEMASSAYQRIVEESTAPLAWAAPLHRLVASVLGLCIMILTLLSLRARQHRLLTLTLLALTIFLALIGLRSGGMHSPAIVIGNLAGGFSMLGLLGWMVFSDSAKKTPAIAGQEIPRGLAGMVILAVALLSFQVLLGGFTSANFAALSCTTLPDCQGSYLPGPGLSKAFDLSRELEVAADGNAVGGPERLAIHKAHRIAAVVTAAVLLMVSWMGFESGRTRNTAIVLLGLTLAEFVVGVASIWSGLPIFMAVAHNWLAALLLLTAIRLLALTRQA